MADLTSPCPKCGIDVPVDVPHWSSRDIRAATITCVCGTKLKVAVVGDEWWLREKIEGE